MKSFRQSVQGRTWRRDQYLITTDHKAIPIDGLTNALASDDFYWAKETPPDAAKEMLENSLCFGLFDASRQEASSPATPEFIGLARCVTDFVTFVYLTDVWVNAAYQGQGLGSWLVRCIQETVEPMPYLRRSMLFTGDWERSVPFYERILDMKVLNETQRGNGLALMEWKGRGHPSYGQEGNSYD